MFRIFWCAPFNPKFRAVTILLYTSVRNRVLRSDCSFGGRPIVKESDSSSPFSFHLLKDTPCLAFNEASWKAYAAASIGGEVRCLWQGCVAQPGATLSYRTVKGKHFPVPSDSSVHQLCSKPYTICLHLRCNLSKSVLLRIRHQSLGYKWMQTRDLGIIAQEQLEEGSLRGCLPSVPFCSDNQWGEEGWPFLFPWISRQVYCLQLGREAHLYVRSCAPSYEAGAKPLLHLAPSGHSTVHLKVGHATSRLPITLFDRAGCDCLRGTLWARGASRQHELLQSA